MGELSEEMAGAERMAQRRSLVALSHNWMLLIGLGLLVLLVGAAILASVIAPHSPFKTGIGPSMAPPSGNLIMGTDKLGRDLFARIVYGSRTTLLVALPAAVVSLLAGLVLGLTAGYLGGRVDQVIMRVLDIFMAFPGLLLAIAVVAILGPSIPNLVITIAVLYTPGMVRIVRGSVLSIKQWEFIDAARVIGGTDFRIVSRHILPNVLSPAIVQVTLNVSKAIITESALSYLGLGAPPPAPSWGQMLSASRWFLTTAPWYALFPGLAIVFSTTTFIVTGNGLRDWLDPRRR